MPFLVQVVRNILMIGRLTKVLETPPMIPGFLLGRTPSKPFLSCHPFTHVFFFFAVSKIAAVATIYIVIIFFILNGQALLPIKV